MTTPDSPTIAELVAQNAALLKYADVMREIALNSSYRRLRASEQMMYLLGLIDEYGVPIDLELFYNLGSDEPDEPPPERPQRRADIGVIN